MQAWDGKQLIQSAAYRVNVADTTGAGDIFRAGFIYGLLHDWPLERQLDFSWRCRCHELHDAGSTRGIQPVATIENLMATGARHERESGVETLD